MYADVVFNRPIEPLTYSVPDRLSHLAAGMRVTVPLKRTCETGIVYRLRERSDLPRVKPVEEVLDGTPVLNDDLIETGEWMARYYLCSVGEALWTIVPKGIRKRETFLDTEGGGREKSITLSADQQDVFQRIMRAVEGDEAERFLLYGVTGSGKTEVYLRVIHEIIARGKGAILLVPEISLTPQTVAYFSRRLGHELAVLHSRLTAAQRINEWHRILTGERRVVIGARSAVFAPLERIGIVIIDEEHETSYKSDETPRYSARGVAMHRTRRHGAILLMGSATPAVESYYLAKEQKIHLLSLPRRVGNQKLPTTHISDLRKTREVMHLSAPLVKAIEERLRKREQIILFLNRRGFSPHVYCENCGYVFKCKNCDITLNYHRNQKRLICHYCGYHEAPPEVCADCGQENIAFAGFGTEKIEDILGERFPGAVIVRMDTDTVKKRTSMSHILSSFSQGHIDILIGTQIVSKGLHFPNVTLVGVLNADIALNFPDFRSAERTFNLITQVSGRAGRSEKGGEVIIQTYDPSHYAIQTAKGQNYEDFFLREIGFRKTLLYPPFCRIVRLVFRGTGEGAIMKRGEQVRALIEESGFPCLSVLGPVACPISRVKNNYRAHIIVKLERVTPFLEVLMRARDFMRADREVYLEIDIDPSSML
jgi:primosomal protein N' (replication factor Y)